MSIHESKKLNLLSRSLTALALALAACTPDTPSTQPSFTPQPTRTQEATPTVAISTATPAPTEIPPTQTPEPTATPDLNTSNYERARQNVDNWLNGSIPLPDKYHQVIWGGISPTFFGVMTGDYDQFQNPQEGVFNGVFNRGIFLGTYQINSKSVLVWGQTDQQGNRFIALNRLANTDQYAEYVVMTSISPSLGAVSDSFQGNARFSQTTLPLLEKANAAYNIIHTDINTSLSDQDFQTQKPHAMDFAISMYKIATGTPIFDIDLSKTNSINIGLLDDRTINPDELPVVYGIHIFENKTTQPFIDGLINYCPTGQTVNHDASVNGYTCNP